VGDENAGGGELGTPFFISVSTKGAEILGGRRCDGSDVLLEVGFQFKLEAVAFDFEDFRPTLGGGKEKLSRLAPEVCSWYDCHSTGATQSFILLVVRIT